MVFGIEDSSNAALREECAKAIVALDFDGYAIGGVSVGEPEPEMMKVIEMTEPFLLANKARYAMGLGTPAQMVELIARGVDMLDCVLPTRSATPSASRAARLRPTFSPSRKAANVSPAATSRALTCGNCSTSTKSSACAC